MRVEELMTSKVFTVEQDDLIDRVFFLIHYERVRHLPVVEKGKVVGIVSDRDLYKALGPKSNSSAIESAAGTNTAELHVVPKKVRHIMRRGVITVKPDTAAADAATIMADSRIGALPVVDKTNKLVGILSSTDILRVFSKIDKASDNKEKKSKPAEDKKSKPVEDKK
ncbi:MAG: CBS domain-containing protein [Gallionella sp.]|nr:CBS domain-containing protein [Gallionella sp.]